MTHPAYRHLRRSHRSLVRVAALELFFRCISCVVLGLLMLLVCSRGANAQSGYTTTTVPTGSGPFDVAVNPATNKICPRANSG